MKDKFANHPENPDPNRFVTSVQTRAKEMKRSRVVNEEKGYEPVITRFLVTQEYQDLKQICAQVTTT